MESTIRWHRSVHCKEKKLDRAMFSRVLLPDCKEHARAGIKRGRFRRRTRLRSNSLVFEMAVSYGDPEDLPTCCFLATTVVAQNQL
jgi:hypothetical protein